MPHIVSTDQPIYFTCIYDGEVYLSELSPIGQAVAAPHELISDASENAYLGKLPADKFPALPVSGWLEQGAIYAYSGALVMVRQSHNRTIYEPSETPALFVVYRPDASGILEWVANEPVVVGTRRTYDGVLYECIQSHTTQIDWTPPAVPALWIKV